MYDPRENRIIIDGEDKTDSVERCWYTSRPNRCQVVFCNFPKTYSYVPSKVLWLKDPVVFDPQHCHLLHKGRRIEPLSYIAAFQQGARRFWYVEYANGTGAHYKGSEVELVRSCLEEPPAQDRFAYLRDVAELNSLVTDDGQKLLLMQYQKIYSVSGFSFSQVTNVRFSLLSKLCGLSYFCVFRSMCSMGYFVQSFSSFSIASP